MRFLVISHTPHHRAGDGEVVGLGPTVRELDAVAAHVDEVVHVAPLHDDPAPGLDVPYRAGNVRYVALPAGGGPGLRSRLALARLVAAWVRTMWRELGRADAVQLRLPAGVSFVGLVLVSVRRRPRVRFAKWAGNWRPDGPDPLTYRLQRAWVRRRLHRGPVTVNGTWPGDPAHVWPFHNPTLGGDELADAVAGARAKVLGSPVRAVIVGRVEEAKGALRAVEVVAGLRELGHDVVLELVGDGPAREAVERRAADDERLRGAVTVVGWLDRAELDARYREAHLMLLPSQSEGFPKVLAEAMAHGVVPVASAVSSIPEIVAGPGAGIVLDPYDTAAWVRETGALLDDPGRWAAMRDAGIDVAARCTYGAYVSRVDEMVRATFGVPFADR